MIWVLCKGAPNELNISLYLTICDRDISSKIQVLPILVRHARRGWGARTCALGGRGVSVMGAFVLVGALQPGGPNDPPPENESSSTSLRRNVAEKAPDPQ